MTASVIERAKRIAHIRRVRKAWNRTDFPALWRNHTTASHEFQLLDVLRDIRLVLTLIMLLLALNTCSKPHVVLHLDDIAGEVR